MKILFLCHKMPYPPVDGGAIATLNMITEFANQGHEVDVLAMQTPKHGCCIADIPVELSKNIGWYQVKVDTAIKPVNAFLNLLFSSKPYNAVRFENAEYDEKLKVLLKTTSYDIIQLEGVYLGPYISTIRSNSSAKISLRAHNIEWKIWCRMAKNENSISKKFYFSTLAKRIRRMEKRVLQNIDFLIPITLIDKEGLPFSNNDRVFVSPTGIVKNNICSAVNINNQTLFHIGALDWMPNQEGILWFVKNVWVNLFDSFKHWQFYIAGRGASTIFIQELKKYPVEFIGEVPDACQFIDQHGIQIVPILSGSGMRIKIIEGMARSKCIVTTSIGAEGIPVEHGKNIIIADSPLQMMEALSDLMVSPEKVEEISRNACSFVQQNYRNEDLIARLAQFYLSKIN